MMNLIGIVKKYFGVILMGGSTLITNGYQFMIGNTPWFSDLAEKLGSNMLIVIIVGAIAISFFMKILRVVFNGIVIALFVGAIFFHEPALNYLRNNQEAIKSTAKAGVQEVSEEVGQQIREETNSFNGSDH
jgi:hypothetical protein